MSDRTTSPRFGRTPASGSACRRARSGSTPEPVAVRERLASAVFRYRGVTGSMGTNEEAARLLREIADLLDLAGERFKPEAYRRAARSIEGLGEDLREVAARGDLDEIPGVGIAISEKLREYLEGGKIP